VAVAHASNVLGTLNPVAEIIAAAHAKVPPRLLNASSFRPCLHEAI
jgi:selenocysteine lyase/cysteine desulfurase